MERRGPPYGDKPMSERALCHGHARIGRQSPTYRCWAAMIARCTDPNVPAYAVYGGAGITVCDRWRNFENFLADMGERPTALTLDRYPNKSGNYEPGNVRWATMRQQCRNRKSNRPVIRSDGVRHNTMAEAAEALPGGNRRCIRDVCTGRQQTHLGFTWRFAE